MRDIQFHKEAFQEFLEWQNIDKAVFKRLVRLIGESLNNPFGGIGKPEALKGNLAGKWSKRINDEHRLIYEVTDKLIRIIACKGHYN